VSLKYIMLGMLREPHSGYDIGKQFAQSLKNFWKAELSQIYPLLNKMENDGLIKSKAGASNIGPTRRIYDRTAKGRRELKSWLQEGPTVGTERVGYLAQVYFLANLNSNDEAVEFFTELRGYMLEKLAILEETESNWRECDPRYPDELPDEKFYSLLTLEYGLKKTRADVEWCDYAVQRIRSRGVR
jgi:PadR family transcriptional regulator AphA